MKAGFGDVSVTSFRPFTNNAIVNRIQGGTLFLDIANPFGVTGTLTVRITGTGNLHQIRRPDLSFVRSGRLPGEKVPVKKMQLAPDLAVEIASPNQFRPGMAAKARRYLDAGTRLVWVVWPRRHEVDVWRPGDTQPSATLHMADNLDGLAVVPGFTLPVADIFG